MGRNEANNLRAQIIGIELDITEVLGGKSYQGHAVTYQGEPYQGRAKDPVRRFIFGNQADLVQAIKAVQVGDWVELGFVENGKYKNLNTMVKVGGGGAPAPKQAPGKAAAPAAPYHDDKADSIARAVALKAGVDLVAAAAANGGMTAANMKKQEYLSACVVENAYRLLPFLLNKEEEDKVDGGPLPWEEVPQEQVGG